MGSVAIGAQDSDSDKVDELPRDDGALAELRERAASADHRHGRHSCWSGFAWQRPLLFARKAGTTAFGVTCSLSRSCRGREGRPDMLDFLGLRRQPLVADGVT